MIIPTHKIKEIRASVVEALANYIAGKTLNIHQEIGEDPKKAAKNFSESLTNEVLMEMLPEAVASSEKKVMTLLDAAAK